MIEREYDTILCRDKEDAKSVIDALGSKVIDWEFLDNGKIKIYCDLSELIHKD